MDSVKTASRRFQKNPVINEIMARKAKKPAIQKAPTPVQPTAPVQSTPTPVKPSISSSNPHAGDND